MQRALGEYVVQGIRTNIPFHRAALAEDAFMQGQYDTRFVERLQASETGRSRLKQAIEETRSMLAREALERGDLTLLNSWTPALSSLVASNATAALEVHYK